MSDRAGAQTRRRLLQETAWAAGAAALLNELASTDHLYAGLLTPV